MKLSNKNIQKNSGHNDDQKMVNHPEPETRIDSDESGDTKPKEDKENSQKSINNKNTKTMRKSKKKDSGETPEKEMTPSVNGSSMNTENISVENNNTENQSTDTISVDGTDQHEMDNVEKSSDSLNLCEKPLSISESKVLRVKITDLKPNPLNKKIYTNSNVDDLLENIRENGGIIHTPILVTKDYVPFSGYRRIECCKLLGIEEIDVVIRDIDEKEIDKNMVDSNVNRMKTGEELFNEMEILRNYCGNNQGKRTDLITEFGGSEGKKEDTQTRISKILKISKGTMTQLNDIHNHNPEYLKKIDNVNVKTNTIHQLVLREQNEMLEKKRMEKLVNKVYDVKPNVYNTSSENMMKYVQKDSVDEIISSIPYYKMIRYENDNRPEIGWEETVEEYIKSLSPIFQNCFSVLKKTGSFFLNVGDSRDEIGCELNIPHRILDHLKNLGFLCVETIIWEKTNPRPIGKHEIYTPSYEFIFHLTKSTDFKTKGLKKSMTRNIVDEQKLKLELDEEYLLYNGKRWDESWIRGDLVRTSVNLPKVVGNDVEGFHHPCPFIEVIPVPLVLDYTDEGDVVLDPFCGISTVGLISLNFHRKFIGFETNENFHKISMERLHQKMESMGMTSEKPETKGKIERLHQKMESMGMTSEKTERKLKNNKVKEVGSEKLVGCEI